MPEPSVSTTRPVRMAEVPRARAAGEMSAQTMARATGAKTRDDRHMHPPSVRRLRGHGSPGAPRVCRAGVVRTECRRIGPAPRKLVYAGARPEDNRPSIFQGG